jgi:hypothetical protein
MAMLTIEHRPRDGSLVLDAGLNIPDTTKDIEGHPRPWDEYDIRAFE